MNLEALRNGGVYLDSNALIFAVETARSVHPASVKALFREASLGRISAHVSPLVRTEVLVRPLRNRNHRLAQAYRTLCSRAGPFVNIRFDDEVADLAAELRAQHPSLKLADALHVAAAVHAGCRALLSADKSLKAAVGKHIEVLAFNDIEA